MKKINISLGREEIKNLKAGEQVLLSGIIYTVRDQAHKRLAGAKKMPVDLRGQVIYYCGPTPAARGKAVGSAGPTTSSRMDRFTPALLRRGLLAMIGKGRRSKEVIKAIKKYKGVYFLTYAGCGALLTKYIKKAKPVAYKELGPEAVYRLEVRDFPVIVGIDAKGRSIYG
ncbi:MAG: FumA C-terminus/TtdB family hydratase beta subunit [Candidatus Omnitrophota bacterium]